MNTGDERWIIPFDAEEAIEMALVGGKCRNLALLITGGLRVPPGFVVTTLAYREFLCATGVGDLIEEAVVASDLGSPDVAGEVERQIGDAFSSHPLSTPLSEEITQAYRSLGKAAAIPVAVRSSAIAEDLAEASFAGQQDTFLNVVGPEQVLQSVRRCWASLYSARAMSYRMRPDRQFGSVSMAVGVQAQVNPRVAGVLFTVNPHAGDPAQVVIEASWGLGESHRVRTRHSRSLHPGQANGSNGGDARITKTSADRVWLGGHCRNARASPAACGAVSDHG